MVQFVSESCPVVLIDFNYLNSNDEHVVNDLVESVEVAFGKEKDNSLGIVAVKNVPEFAKMRASLLPLVFELGKLSPDTLKKYEIEESLYSSGWSCGKEAMVEGQPDTSKGSYYFNPLSDNPTNDPELISKYPEIFYPNVWPREDLPQLEVAAKELSRTVVHVGRLLSRFCDLVISSRLSQYDGERIFSILKESPNCKARLLHYYPPAVSKTSPSSAWCGWHNDHSTLTGLIPAMYFDSEGNEVSRPSSTQGGLYIRSRDGNITEVSIPSDYLAFQIGESGQIHSGGVLEATPHYVKPPKSSNKQATSRVTMAVFMEPSAEDTMDVPDQVNVEEFNEIFRKQQLPEGVPLLTDRWDNGVFFSEFSSRTIAAYYK